MRIYVGNLPYDITEQGLRQEFEAYGSVDSVSIVTDKYNGKPKGFAFVEMASKSESINAISELNGKMLDERTIVVNEARPRTSNSSSGFGERRSGGNGGRNRRF